MLLLPGFCRQAVLLEPRIQAARWHPDSARCLNDRIARFGYLLNRLDLELFRVTLSAYGKFIFLRV